MAQAAVGAEGMSRREFLFYIWGASIALFTLQFTGLFIWFALPRFREGEFGGAFRLSVGVVPEKNGVPANFPDGRFWIVNLDTTEPNQRMYWIEGDPDPIRGVAAIYKVCTHLGCIYPWNQTNERFECPCHGSKYRLDGRRIESPAPRTLDRFRIELLDGDGAVLTQSEVVDGHFAAINLEDYPDAVEMLVQTGARLNGPIQTLICDIQGNCP